MTKSAPPCEEEQDNSGQVRVAVRAPDACGVRQGGTRLLLRAGRYSCGSSNLPRRARGLARHRWLLGKLSTVGGASDRRRSKARLVGQGLIGGSAFKRTQDRKVGMRVFPLTAMVVFIFSIYVDLPPVCSNAMRLKGRTMKRTFAKLLLLGILGLEVTLPALVLITTKEPRTYSWSMYSRSLATYRYVGLTRDDQKVDLDPAEVGSPWNAIHYGPQTLRMICARHPELDSVTRYYDGKAERSERC